MRATGRGRELAIRTTLGAGQWRLVRQMLTEGIVLSMIGGLGGLALGIAGLRGLIAMSSQQLPERRKPRCNRPSCYSPGARDRDRVDFWRDPGGRGDPWKYLVALKDDTTRGARHGNPAGARHARDRRDGARTHAARRRGPADQELLALQAVNPGFSTENVLTAQIALPSTRIPSRRTSGILGNVSWRRRARCRA